MKDQNIEISVPSPDVTLAEKIISAPPGQGVMVTEEEVNSVVRPPRGVTTTGARVVEIIAEAACNPDIDMAKFRELMEWQQVLENRQKEAAFNAAMAAAQGEISRSNIKKDRFNKQTNSWYSTMAAINPVIVPIYTKHGLSLVFGEFESKLEGHLGVSCMICHAGGHKEERSMMLPYDLTGIGGKVNKTSIHAHGSTTEYGRRYLTRLIFNIVSSEDAEADDDGQHGGNTNEQVYLNDFQIENIKHIIQQIGDNTLLDRILRANKTPFPSLEAIPADGYTGIIRKLKANALAKGVELVELAAPAEGEYIPHGEEV